MSGTRLGHSGPENRVDEGSPCREDKDRLEMYLGVPLWRGRMAAVPLAVGRERSPVRDEGSVLGSVGPLGGALQQVLGSIVNREDLAAGGGRSQGVLEQVELGDP